jgi:hypothetical protein
LRSAAVKALAVALVKNGALDGCETATIIPAQPKDLAAGTDKTQIELFPSI